jgi:hypothetical protein
VGKSTSDDKTLFYPLQTKVESRQGNRMNDGLADWRNSR